MKLFRFSLLLLLCGCALIKQDRILNEDIHLEGYLRIPGNYSNQELLLKRNGRFKWVILPLGAEEKQVFKGRFRSQGDSIYILDLKGDSATLSSDYRLHYKGLDSALRMMVIETNFNFRNRHWRVVQIGDDYVGMSVIAGRYEYESNYVYRFKPWREGTYTFNSPVFVVNGDIIPSKEVEIEIDDIAEETETTRQDFDRWQATQIKRSANMRFTILGQKVLIEKRVKGAWEDYQIIPLNDFVFQLNSGTYEKL